MHDVVDYIHLQGEELSYANYTRWESGNTFPGVKTHLLKTIAELFQKNGLKVESNWILTGEGFHRSSLLTRQWMKIRYLFSQVGRSRMLNLSRLGVNTESLLSVLVNLSSSVMSPTSLRTMANYATSGRLGES